MQTKGWNVRYYKNLQIIGLQTFSCENLIFFIDGRVSLLLKDKSLGGGGGGGGTPGGGDW